MAFRKGDRNSKDIQRRIETEIADLKNTLAYKDDEIKRLNETIKESRDHAQTLATQAEIYKDDFQRERRDREDLHFRLTHALEESTMKIDALENENKLLQQMNDELNNELKQYKSANDELLHEVQVTKQNIDVLELELQNCRAELNTTNLKLQNCRAELNASNLELENCRAELNATKLEPTKQSTKQSNDNTTPDHSFLTGSFYPPQFKTEQEMKEHLFGQSVYSYKCQLPPQRLRAETLPPSPKPMLTQQLSAPPHMYIHYKQIEHWKLQTSSPSVERNVTILTELEEERKKTEQEADQALQELEKYKMEVYSYRGDMRYTTYDDNDDSLPSLETLGNDQPSSFDVGRSEQRDHLDTQEMIVEVMEMTRRPSTKEMSEDDPSLPYDPNLVCPKCSKRFRIGEIQKFNRHISDTHPS